MDRLRAMFGALGFAEVETFIASGNVIFSAPGDEGGALERDIEQHLRRELGYEVTTLVRSTAELGAIAAHRPFAAFDADSTGYTESVGLLRAAPDSAARRAVAELQTPTDEFHLHDREIYWLCRTRVSDTRITGPMLERALGMPTTMRNMTTIRKLVAKYPAIPVERD